MKNTFEQQIYEIFGTTDPKELRRLSKDAEQYQQLAQKEALRHAAGRKPAFSLPQIIQMAAMQQQGKSIAEIARTFQVSRQTVYNQIARAHCFSTDPDVKTRMCFLYRDQLCTTIDIDFRHEKIAIQNYTKKIPLRAFGVVEHPTWDDFTWFLESRCFPKTRDHAKDILKEMGFRATLGCASGVNYITRDPEALYQLKRVLRPPYVSSEKFFKNIFSLSQ